MWCVRGWPTGRSRCTWGSCWGKAGGGEEDNNHTSWTYHATIDCSDRNDPTVSFPSFPDWCCFDYFVKNSLVTLLEAICAQFFLMITGFCPNMTVDEIEKRQFFNISVPPSARGFHIDAQLSSRDCVFHCRRISTKPEAIVMTGDPPTTPRPHRQPRRPLNESSTEDGQM